MRIIFTQTYNLSEQEIKFVRGVAGLYFIYLTQNVIAYPFAKSKLIYIGMSESRQNSLFKRLGGHLTGQSGNMGIRNYAKTQKLKFAYYSAEVLSNSGNENLFDIESFFLSDFLDRYGCFPICNGQSGHRLSEESSPIAADVDWSFFD
ncbi:GIY-YIG nuclease family protein [Brucella intermedia]|uniref:GIY-YIG nuclease family protein n=1 Tax=Brucella pseudintermedia TaxID=370111 RepID=UPI00124CD337|nr:GIY-YIG nuclease family protein [Brucella anthropi]KAB2710626.1 GIY-YIG nuclease family protein [Brucella intermedia]